MQRRPRETAIEKYFVAQVEAAFPGAECRKFTSRMHDPDRICLFPSGRVVFLELKRPGEAPRAGQIRAHERLKKLGFKVYVVDSKPGVLEFIEEIHYVLRYT